MSFRFRGGIVFSYVVFKSFGPDRLGFRRIVGRWKVLGGALFLGGVGGRFLGDVGDVIRRGVCGEVGWI